MSDARRYAVWPEPRSRSRSLKGSRPSVPHGTNFWDIRLVAIQWPWNLGYGSLKVIGTDVDQFATYDFLLTFHSNHGPISYRFRDIRRFQLKIAKSHPLCILCPRWRGSPGNWIPALGSKKTRMMGLTGRQKSFTISSAVWIECTNVTDGQTDGRTDTEPQRRPRLRIASRDKKEQWPPKNSPDLNTMEISCLWSDARTYFETFFRSPKLSELKVALEKIWENFPQIQFKKLFWVL